MRTSELCRWLDSSRRLRRAKHDGGGGLPRLKKLGRETAGEVPPDTSGTTLYQVPATGYVPPKPYRKVIGSPLPSSTLGSMYHSPVVG